MVLFGINFNLYYFILIGQGLQILCLGPDSLAAAGRIDGVTLLRQEVRP